MNGVVLDWLAGILEVTSAEAATEFPLPITQVM
jgi:hypothetical protein